MNDIKFRAWVLGTGHMIYFDDFYGIEDVDWTLNWGSKKDISLIIDHVNKDGLKLMRYTGLKDKNGKEIYEGDIVECPYGAKEVYWHRGIYWLRDHDVSYSLHEYNQPFEVIGNIYENTNLLREVDDDI